MISMYYSDAYFRRQSMAVSSSMGIKTLAIRLVVVGIILSFILFHWRQI